MVKTLGSEGYVRVIGTLGVVTEYAIRKMIKSILPIVAGVLLATAPCINLQ